MGAGVPAPVFLRSPHDRQRPDPGRRPRGLLPLPRRLLLRAGAGVRAGEALRLHGGRRRSSSAWNSAPGRDGWAMAFAAEGIEDLLVDYTRLFLGPVDARAQPLRLRVAGAGRSRDAGFHDGRGRPLRGRRIRALGGFPRPPGPRRGRARVPLPAPLSRGPGGRRRARSPSGRDCWRSTWGAGSGPSPMR